MKIILNAFFAPAPLCADSEKDDEPVGLNLGSLIGDIRNMLSVMGLSYMIYDDYELLREIVNTYADNMCA